MSGQGFQGPESPGSGGGGGAWTPRGRVLRPADFLRDGWRMAARVSLSWARPFNQPAPAAKGNEYLSSAGEMV